MANRTGSVEQALARLQQVLREPDPASPASPVYNGRIPDDLRAEARMLSLYAPEKLAFDRVCQCMVSDMRFEYLGNQEIRDAVWRFVCEVQLKRSRGLVPRFISDHAHDPFETTCYFPVQLLTVKEELELHNVRLLPRPVNEAAGREPGSVAAVRCRGTDYQRMAARSRPIAEHALRVLRASLRDYNFMPDEQLRFRLGYSVWFDGGAAGWTPAPDQGWELELDEELLRTARQAPLYHLASEGRNDVERRTNVALQWFEQAQLVGDPLMEVLFCFTALEAILGDTSEGLKAPSLAIRRAMLSLLTQGGFRHPSLTFALYDKVRNAAIHGEQKPQISAKAADEFAWDVRRALNEFLEFAEHERLTKRSQVRAALDGNPRREKVVAGLLREDPKIWAKFLEPEGSRAYESLQMFRRLVDCTVARGGRYVASAVRLGERMR